MGISKEMCLELMAGHWNEEKASPAWQLEGGEGEGPSLSDKVENAYKYASDPIGAHNPEVEFAVIAEVVKARGGSGGGEDERKREKRKRKREEKPKVRPRLLNISGWDEVAIPAREWAIVDCVPLRQVGIFSGRRRRWQEHHRTDEECLPRDGAALVWTSDGAAADDLCRQRGRRDGNPDQADADRAALRGEVLRTWRRRECTSGRAPRSIRSWREWGARAGPWRPRRRMTRCTSSAVT